MIDVDTLAGLIADSLEDPTHCVAGDHEGDAFARFDTQSTSAAGVGEVTIRAVVSMVSDGENEVPGAEGEVVEIVVRRVPAGG